MQNSSPDTRAARHLSARLLLPLVTLPLLGAGVALALIGWVATGITLLAAGILVPRLIKRSAPHFLLQNALADERAYAELTVTGLLCVTPRESGGRGTVIGER